jgi:hypothetical protein
MKRYGVGRYKLILKHPEMISLSGIMPFLFTIGIVLLLIFSIFNKTLMSIFFVISGFYLLIIGTVSFYITMNKNLKFFIYLLAIFFVIHFGLGIGLIKGITDNVLKR